MPSDTCTASRILDKLHEHVMRIRNSVPENGHIDLHDLDSVEHVMNFDFEHLNEKAVPPLYFEPMQPVELKQFPPDPAQVRSFFDIIERGNDGSSCCRQSLTSSLTMQPATQCLTNIFRLWRHLTVPFTWKRASHGLTVEEVGGKFVMC
ncbi:Pro-kumamolisin, activation domain family protein [Aspergillus niger]|uniref:Pro-kumamolisin, activation domain family protein n=1 Tax=Aspergillus niger TaxID=5061 RepID=A0A505HYI2_ASPNG|nr:hypothetical protein CBS147345_10857 [Aspergillus niger]TPR04320.1 Pro-kumamolisin, activation domain family protein [Aspergillus niger]